MSTAHSEPEHANAQLHAHPNYIQIWGILVALLVVSVCGPMLGIKAVTLITAFGIALVKAYLVAKNFMHLNIERSYIVFLLVTAVGLMVLMFGGVAGDVMDHQGRNWRNLAAQEEVNRALAGVAGESGAEQKGSTPGAAQPVAGAEENFKIVCSPCHGEKGDGKGAAAVALTPKPANFTDPEFWQTRDKAHIEKVITLGGAAVGKSPLMAPFGSRFSAAEISALADYLMRMKK